MGAGASCARALITKVDKSIVACVAVFPIDLDAFRFGDGDMFRIGAVEHGFASMVLASVEESMEMPFHVAHARDTSHCAD